MKDPDQLPAVDPNSGYLNVIIETPRGCRNKYKFDEGRRLWRLNHVLPEGMSFPYDFGFIPSTRGADGDPLDVLLLMEEPAFPGCVISARLIGVIEAEQTEDGKSVRNDRLIAVVENATNPAELHSLKEMSPRRLDEVEHFFVSYNEMVGRRFKPLARKGPNRALKLLEQAIHGNGPEKKGARRSGKRDKK